jgi:hypothetical protein
MPRGIRLQGHVRNDQRLFVARDARVLDVLTVLTTGDALVNPSSLPTIAFPCFPTEASLLPTCSGEYWHISSPVDPAHRRPRAKFRGVIPRQRRSDEGNEGEPTELLNRRTEVESTKGKEKEVEQPPEKHPSPTPQEIYSGRFGRFAAARKCSYQNW